jgi:hypothetical protein
MQGKMNLHLVSFSAPYPTTSFHAKVRGLLYLKTLFIKVVYLNSKNLLLILDEYFYEISFNLLSPYTTTSK